MGINNLNTFLRNNCKEVFETIHLSEYAYKKVSIDISLFLCKFKSIYAENWLFAFVNLVACLRRNEIHSVFIYDTGAPDEKSEERAERVRQREKNNARVLELETMFKKFEETNILDEELKKFYFEKVKDKFDVNIQKKSNSLLFGKKFKENKDNKNQEVDGVDIALLKAKIEKMRVNVLNISSEDFLLTRKLFDILNIPYYDAPLEAECCCSDLCKRGLVDAVMSEDTDVLAYGAPIFLTKIDTFNDTCVRLKHSDILERLKLNESQFLDLCIMCGCDYNKNIPKIGPESSYKLLLKHGNIDEIENNNKHLDTSILNYKRVRELFTGYAKLDIVDIPYCGFPNFEELENFSKINNIVIKNIHVLKKSFIQQITFIENEDNEDEKIDINENDCEMITKIETNNMMIICNDDGGDNNETKKEESLCSEEEFEFEEI
jgi:5'-3' exonuclease